MARVLKDGSLSGRVGNLIYYQVNGVTFARTYSKGTNPNTPKQQIQRAKMKLVQQFLKQFRQVLLIGYQDSASVMRPYNEAVSYHFKHAMVPVSPEAENPDFRIDLQLVKFTRGFILTPQIYTCDRNINEITLTWNPKLLSDYNRHSDKLALIAYTPGMPPVIDFNIGLRMSGSGKLILPGEYTAPVHLWAFYHNSHGNARVGKEGVSDCCYLGQI